MSDVKEESNEEVVVEKDEEVVKKAVDVEELKEAVSEETKKPEKKKRADKKQDKLKEQIEELEDKTKRQMAEFENFRKRSEKEKSMMFDMGVKHIVEKILPVVDNFERGLQSISEEEQNSFYEGMLMIYKQMIANLEQAGVKPIEAIGVEFNPDLHNAVMQVESEEYESGFVAQELQKGYKYNDTVIRHSMVAVVN